MSDDLRWLHEWWSSFTDADKLAFVRTIGRWPSPSSVAVKWAADRIEAQDARIAELEAERADYRGMVDPEDGTQCDDDLHHISGREGDPS
jgi:hypothetical protein